MRVDRKRQRAKKGRFSGGVALYVRDHIASELVFECSSGVIEAMGVMLESLNTIVYIVYRQPDHPKHRSTSKQFKTFINKLEDHMSSLPTPSPTVMLLGDFNLPHANWDSGEPETHCPPDHKKMIKDLYELSLNHFLVQQLDGPTHEAGNTLELAFSNNAESIHSFSSSPCLFSDHHYIEINTSFCPDDELKPTTHEEEESGEASAEWRKLNFFSDKVDWTSLSAELSAYNWNSDF